MPKYSWTTDCHLDHIVSDSGLIEFGQSLIKHDPAGIFITGDISTADNIVYHLSALERIVERPIYFVLGNHDYWNSDITEVRKQLQQVCNMSQYLRYMTLSNDHQLTPQTAIVGHDSWYDAGNGDPWAPGFMMNDWYKIRDFVPHSGGSKFMSLTFDVRDRASLISFCQKLAHESVLHVQNGIKNAVRKNYKNIIVLTHFPPFKESHVYNGTPPAGAAVPWYTCKMMGDMLLDAARTFPAVNFTILSGHTHNHYVGNPAKNMKVCVGKATYGRPSLVEEVEVI